METQGSRSTEEAQSQTDATPLDADESRSEWRPLGEIRVVANHPRLAHLDEEQRVHVIPAGGSYRILDS